MTLAAHEIAMLFGRIDKPDDRVRFLDDLDVTVAMDTRTLGGNTSMSLDVDVTPVTFRASYTDIMLIIDITNKAIALASAATQSDEQKQIAAQTSSGDGTQVAKRGNGAVSTRATASQHRRNGSLQRAEVVVSKETVRDPH